MDSVPILKDLQGKTQTLATIPRCMLWRDSISWIRLGDFKYSGVGFNDFPFDYDIYSSTRYNVQENESSATPPLRMINELDSILDAFIEDASDPTRQESFFDND